MKLIEEIQHLYNNAERERNTAAARHSMGSHSHWVGYKEAVEAVADLLGVELEGCRGV